MRENEVERYLRKRVKELGGEHRKIVYQGRTGSPDDWCFFPGGLLVIIECKRPGKTPTPQQREELFWLTKMGFNATWASSKEEVDLALNAFVPDFL